MVATAQEPLGLLGIDGLLSEQDREIALAVRRYVDDRIRPEIAQWYESGELPARELAKELGSLGALGMHLSGYGCAGATATAYGLACTELEAGDSGLRSLVSVQGSLAMFAIWQFGSTEQKEQWLPRMAAGDAIGCFGLTEPDFGSDPAGMRCRARRDGSDWILSGTKMWITNGSIADVAVVWCKDDDHQIRGFLMPAGTTGYSAVDVKRKLSLRASVTSELILDNVRLPASAMLPGAEGLGAPLRCLNEARFGIAFGALGAARDALTTAIAYTRERSIFGRPLAAYQISQTKIADMTLELGKGMLLALHLGKLKESGNLKPAQVSLGKLNSVRTALTIARECRALIGAAGVTLDYPIMRHASNLESVLTYEGTSEIHQLIVGRAVTGEDAFR